MIRSILTWTLIASFFLSCNENAHEHTHDDGHDHTDEHDHSHEQPAEAPPMLSYTLYSEQMELFVEFAPLVIGEEINFLAHFTLLGEVFRAMEEGEVRISLEVAGKEVSMISDSCKVPGIFSLKLVPPRVGLAKLVFDIKTSSFTDQLIIDNLEVFGDSEVIHPNGEQAHENEISYLKEQAWKTEFATVLVSKRPFHDIIKTNGKLVSAPGDEVIVTSKSSGIVVFAGTNIIVGSEVQPGKLMFNIAGAGLSEDNIDSRFKESKLQLDKAKADFDRATALVADKIISQKDFQSVKLQYERANIEFNRIAESYSSNGKAALSEAHGFIKNVLVNQGEFVEAGTPLAVISRNKTLLLQANVTQKHFDKLKTIKSAKFKLAGNDHVFSTDDLNGKLISYGRSFTPQSPFIPVNIELDNTGDLISGSAAEVFLETTEIPDALVVPVSSLIEEQGVYFVYVQTGGESFIKREVKTGVSDGLHVQLLSGVKEGERVVSKGAYNIKLSSASGSLPAHSHEH